MHLRKTNNVHHNQWRQLFIFYAYDVPKSCRDKFCQTTFSRPDRLNDLVIIYTGDEIVAVQFPHDNASSSIRPVYVNSAAHTSGSDGQCIHVVQEHLPHYDHCSCAEYSTSTCYISPTKRGTDMKYQENTKKPGSTIVRHTLQRTRAGIRQQLHTSEFVEFNAPPDTI